MLNYMKILSLLGLLIASKSFAQSTDTTFRVPEITVEGESPESGYLENHPAATHLSGNRLERKKASTIGETLSREPGVSSTFFGPNASRPVIRGLDGDRIRIMENGTGTLDASSASPDHAVSVDPLVTDSIDVVRGPSALLYGNTAIGGVVNVRTKRIADRMIDSRESRVQGSLSSVDRGRTLGLLDREKLGQWILELDASGRGAEDYAVPGQVRSSYLQAQSPLAPGEAEETARVRNSSNRTYQLGMGATHIDHNDRYGIALSGLQSNYGTVAEKEVMIDLQRFRLELEGEKRLVSPFIEVARVKGAGTVYRHQEIEGSEVGTTFRNKGGELRLDLKHARMGAMQGNFGLQGQVFRFSALGEEAFLPSTFNQSYGLFAFEEWRAGAHLRPSAGFRVDSASVRSDDDANFGPASSKHFFNPSVAMGMIYDFDSESSLGLNLTYTERAPNYQELFAQGTHVATWIFEQGNTQLSPERSLGAELFFKNKSDGREIKSGVFVQNFNSFIALSPTGSTFTNPDSGETFPISSFNSVSALLTGFEAAWTEELPFTLFAGKLESELQFDYVRGIDRTHSGNLPRMPPFREGLTLNYRKSGWTGYAQLQRSEKQGLVAANELPTDAFTLVNLGVEAPVSTSFGDYRLAFRVNNVFDAEARVHTSFLKDIAPLPGRSFILALQASL